MIRVRECPSVHPEWDAFVLESPQATLFHLSVWKDIVQKAYGHHAVSLAAELDGELHGLLPLFLIRSRLFGRALVSVPFADYGGICARTSDATTALVTAAADLARRFGVDHVELRHSDPVGVDIPTGTDKVSMTLTLPADIDTLWKQLPLERRSRIRKAQTAGLLATVHGPEAGAEFYRTFSQNMRDLGSPVHSRRFFEYIASCLSGHTRIILVSHQGVTVGVAWCLSFRDRLMVPWSSSLRSHFSLYPNFLLFWSALEYACRNGYRTFDFGRSSPDSGTYTFKRGWNAVPRPLPWQYLLLKGRRIPEPSLQQERYRLFVTLWRHLPLSVANRLGPRLRRSISL